MRHILALAALFPAAAALAAGNPELGRKAHDSKCVACHVQTFGGDGTRVYTRSPRLVYDLASLAKRVAHCEKQATGDSIPDEEAHLVAYLNQRFYHFK
jgi:mono/diheme cytochrome c family protein